MKIVDINFEVNIQSNYSALFSAPEVQGQVKTGVYFLFTENQGLVPILEIVCLKEQTQNRCQKTMRSNLQNLTKSAAECLVH